MGYMLMIDELKRWPNAHPPFDRGSCHLTIEGDDPDLLERLHEFAEALGLKRSWFQPHICAPHYDLTPAKRRLALTLGAQMVPAREQARRRIDARGFLGRGTR